MAQMKIWQPFVMPEASPHPVILESPFAQHKQDPARTEAIHIAYMRMCLRDMALRGEYGIASHAVLTQPGVLDDDDPNQRHWGIELGLGIRNTIPEWVAYVDFGMSKGMLLAEERAVQSGRTLKKRSIHNSVMICLHEIMRMYRESDSTSVSSAETYVTLCEQMIRNKSLEIRNSTNPEVTAKVQEAFSIYRYLHWCFQPFPVGGCHGKP